MARSTPALTMPARASYGIMSISTAFAAYKYTAIGPTLQMKPKTSRCGITKKKKKTERGTRTDIERDIMMWKTEVERQRRISVPEYRDGDYILDNMPPQPPCSDRCSFKKLPDCGDNAYVCLQHFRVHKCGDCCCVKIQSRENWTCPWTKNVLGMSIIAEDKTSSSNCGRHLTGESYSKRGMGDEAQEKCEKKHKRVVEAMKEAADVTLPALEAEGIDPEKYRKLLRDYFSLIAYHTDMFMNHRVLTKKAVVQFGLACSYMQRNGFSTPDPSSKGSMKVFFKKCASFEQHLPKTHALIQKGYKVRAVTRTQDLLRRYLAEALVKAPDLDLSFYLPVT